METRVTYRTSEETVKRLQELSDKYGISQSALLTMLVNERWLLEHVQRSVQPGQEVSDSPQPPPNFPSYVSPGKKKRKRKH
jgi:hypothetical protein